MDSIVVVGVNIFLFKDSMRYLVLSRAPNASILRIPFELGA